MLRSLPEPALAYVVEKLPPYVGLLAIKTDDAGNIMASFGSHHHYFESEPKIGDPIDKLTQALFGMIPPMVDPMVLQRIHTDKDGVADIHIVGDDDGCYWIFFMDQSKEVDRIRDLLQRINETSLSVEKKENSGQLENPFGRLDIFGYMAFERMYGNHFKINGLAPAWISELETDFDVSAKEVSLSELFPFLEIFLQEAESFWNTDAVLLESGIWAEKTKKGEEALLKAYAVNHQSRHYLMINTLNNSIDVPRETIQRAREQSLAYDQLEKTERKLQELLGYKDKFVSIVSHDLRSPVAAVLGIAEMMANDEVVMNSLDDFYKEMVLSIKSEMNRLLDYNDKLYHWSNLELGNFELVRSSVSLEALAKSAGRMAEAKMKAKHIQFHADIPKNLNVEVDETLFSQVLNNLMGNAVKFTPENGLITIYAEKEPGGVIIKVVDTGVGMPREVQENLFAGFSRNSTMGTGGEKGTGLGLGIVKKIIDAHAFDLWVESEPGKGSSFVIRIPAKPKSV